MRITNQMITNGAIRHIQENQESMRRLQERIASGKNFENSSDDPVNASLSLGLRSSVRTMQSYIDANAINKDWMNATDFAFQEMDKLADNANTLILRGLNDTLGDTERVHVLAPEMDAILKQAVSIANSSHNNQYLFSGFQITTEPFEVTGSTVDYNGDAGLMQRSLAPNQSVTLNVPGDVALQDFLEAIVAARDALLANDTTSLRTALSALQSGMTTVDQYRTSHGARMRQVQSTSEYLEKAQLETKSLLSKKEDTNLAEAIVMLKGQETTYQAVLEVSQRAISATSLFDMLR